ncbi:MAG: hypothetical protein RLZZ400_777 [Actinomycetota bacterium]|jgi:deoxyribodipyrimidine photo-lyase
MAVIFWFRRDLRLSDHPALNEAVCAAAAEPDSKVFAVASPVDYVDSATLEPTRQESLWQSWRELDEDLGHNLTVVSEPIAGILELSKRTGARKIFVSAAYDTRTIEFMKGARKQFESAGLELHVGPGNYAVAPGRVRKPDGTPYRVYTPFYKGWLALGWEQPHERADGDFARFDDLHIGLESPSYKLERTIRAGERYALRTLQRFIDRGALVEYSEDRNRADLSGTSHLSHALAHGEIHPRTILARLGNSNGEIVFAKEIAWREFYADVLWHNPDSLTDYLEPRFSKMRYDDGTELGELRFEAWKRGETGYPMVDAGMRQLMQTGWMHNRVRMIVASFLVKDLHLEWQRGAEWFERHLTDFDPASNSHGWQWTAGCGTDASPYYRVFNPVLQGLKFDPNGDYVRKYIPELRHLAGASAHEPWNQPDGYLAGYPKQVVDHGVERDESLARLEEIKVK